MNQDVIKCSAVAETVADVPDHIFRGLPEEVTLCPSDVDKTRLGIWTKKLVPKGKKFGPFIGEKKKRSQVKNNVYMWEVYYPNLGWMCIDATDPQKGNWLRYVNWARSVKEQNLCPLEINRAIYYKTLKPIEPGEELLVWYNGEDNPEIAAALEEERAASRSKRSSPKSRRGKRKTVGSKKRIDLNKPKQDNKTLPDISGIEMKDSPDAPNEEDGKPLGSPVLSLEQTAVIQEMVNHNVLPEPVTISTPEVQTVPESRAPDATLSDHEVVDDFNRESSERESVNLEDEQMKMLDDVKSTSDETPESSPKKKSVAKLSKAKGDVNGDLPESFMYPCQHCERKFTTKQGLERHMHIHVSTINHAFKCRYCGKAFGTQINRRRHERRHEAGPKRKPLILSASGEFGHGHKHIIDSLKASEEHDGSRFHYKLTDSDREASHSGLGEENGDSRELHPCKYCKKVFGTHTNMRRHQRRVHERHLLPKGVRRKGNLLEDPQLKSEQTPPAEYVASTEIEEDGEAEDIYIMDISNNITENLAYYIDGKIQTNNVASCDVVEVEASSTEGLGLSCLITPIKVEVSQNFRPLQIASENPLSDSSCSGKTEPKKRRTISPPRLTKIKTEVEVEPITPSCSLTIPLSVSVGDGIPFQKEKSVFLSSKLKQLLQMQDSSKSPVSPSLLSEVPKISPAVSTLSTGSNRFKRRTTSPPNSPQHSPAPKDFVKQVEVKPSWSDGIGSKIPKLESQESSPVWSLSGREEREGASPMCSEDLKVSKDWTSNVVFGNVFTQQPLDLSSGLKQKSESQSKSQVPWESVLDLSVTKKTFSDSESKESKGSNLCIGVKKKKPTTCMLKKVLLNEYDGLGEAGESSPQSESALLSCKIEEHKMSPEFGVCSSDEVSLPPDDASPAPVEDMSIPVCQSPPVLTPSEIHSPSPSTPCMTDTASSPPPLLTSNLPSLPESSCSVPPTPSCPSPLSASTQSPLPILSRPVSPSPPPSPTTDHSVCASPGPPTLSSSSTSSSGSPSSSSSSCSSPPPLSVVSSIISPTCTSELPAITFVKKETLDEEEEVTPPPKEPLRTRGSEPISEGFNKIFLCNVCELPFSSIKDLAKHIYVHAEEWPFKCEFCVQLFKEVSKLSEHRSLLHGVGKIFVCSLCKKEFAFLCNLQQHQQDLHADKEYSHHELENGTLRPQNFTDPSKASSTHQQRPDDDSMTPSPEEAVDLNDSSEELYTAIKIMASGEKSKDPDVRLGQNQHYPSFKPPPFQYHNKNPMGIGATATNFTTHNIPQTFSTAIRCTKCGKGVDNMPELHKHILVCASASDKKRYTPKKNPVPLRPSGQPKNRLVLLESPEKNSFRRMGQPKKLTFTIESGKMSSNKLKLNALKRKKQLVHKAILQKNKTAKQKADFNLNLSPDLDSHVCPYCNRKFTYIRSLNKHASYSCPKKPASPPTKKHASKALKKTVGSYSTSAKKRKASSTRRTADAEIKMQSTEVHLGKTRARSLAPSPVQLTPVSIKYKQSVKNPPPVKSKKPTLSIVRNSSPVRLSKSHPVAAAAPAEVKRAKKVAMGNLPQSFGKLTRKLHVRVQRSKLQSKSAAKNKKTDKFRKKGKSRERIGGPITRSSQQTTSTDVSERRDESRGKHESSKLKNDRYRDGLTVVLCSHNLKGTKYTE
ncbi:PR domain zinc finger protein 2 [Pelodytes ibericus]